MNSIKNKLRLNDAMNLYEKQFEYGILNLINAPTGCGKTTFIMNEFLTNTNKYIKGTTKGKYNYCNKLSKVLYICDTTMLKDSVLSENNNITEVFGKGSIIEAKDFNNSKKVISEDNGTIKVMTYATLGWCIKNCKDSILNNFDIIIADEIQNLFKYCIRYNVITDKEGNKKFNKGEYINLINNLDELTKSLLFIGLSGTTNYIYSFKDRYKDHIKFKIKNIFTERERETLFTNNYEPIFVNCIFSKIKTVDFTKVKENGCKIYIYTKTIKQSKKYKKWFEMNGLKAEWLCSINNKKEVISYDESGKEVIEKVQTMNDYQIHIRDRLINGSIENDYKDKGTVPNDLDVLIVNGGYETGWNLIDERFQVAFIDTTDLEEQKQARNRLRHDIIALYCLNRLYDKEGNALEYGQFGELIPWEVSLGIGKYKILKVFNYDMLDIDKKYIGINITKDLKEEIIFLYGVRNLIDKTVTWTTVKRDLKKKGYIIDTTNGHGTYIFKEGKEIKKDSKKVVKKMDKLIKFLKDNEGCYIYEDDINKLIKIANIVKSDGELQDKPKKINDYFSSIDINYIILNKPTHGKKRWLIENYS